MLSPDEHIGNGNEIYLFFENASFSLSPGDSVFRNASNPAFFNLFIDALGRAVPSGLYFMALWLDDLQQVEESNELNNSSLEGDRITISNPFGVVRAEGTARAAVQLHTVEREEQPYRASKLYNGKTLPPPEMLVQMVEVRRTPEGGISLRAVDDVNPVLKGVNEALVLPKQIESANKIVFPITEEIRLR